MVLEWTQTRAAPSFGKHYSSGNMPATQKAATGQGVVWLAVNSTERAVSDYLQPRRSRHWMRARVRRRTAVLMDEDGVIGQAYGAAHAARVHRRSHGARLRRQHRQLIPSARADDIKTATNYVNQALGRSLRWQGGPRRGDAARTAVGGEALSG